VGVSAETHACHRKDTSCRLADQSPEKFPLIHAVLEGFVAIDEHDRNLIVELPAQFTVAIDIDFMPGKSTAARKLRETLFDHFAKVASLARVNYHLARV
jgi:hypothetical protein